MPNMVRAVSVAVPREEIVYGKPVSTSIVRLPQTGPLFFGASGPNNNRTAVHTEHVLAFASAHYDYWTGELGVPRNAWPWAFWGENLTLDGLDESRLCIGDRLRCGEAVFEVTGPRTPCFKLSWRLGQDVEFLGRLVASGRIGVYLRVVVPGVVQAGDLVALAPAGRTRITVAQVARMIGRLDPDDLPVARELLRMHELGDTARQLVGYRLNLLDDVLRCRDGRWQGWRDFRIAALAREGRDAMSVTLAARDGGSIAPYRAGQHIALELPTSPRTVRIWSLSDFALYPDRYRITVRRQGGVGSRWINDVARVGDVVRVRAPSGRFVLDRSSFHRVVLVSAGVGMTPMLAMLRAHVLRGDEAPAIHWLHAASDASAILHAGEVDDLLRQASRATRQVHLTRPSSAGDAAASDRTGRIARGDLAEILQTPFLSADGAIVEPGEYTHFYVCGPDAFVDMVVRSLRELRVEDDQIFTERFVGTSVVRAGASRTASAIVELSRSGVTVVWDPLDDATLLEMAEAAGVDAPSSCRAGACGTCEVALVSGTVAHDPPPSVSVGEGRCLTCCARPSSDAVTLDL